MGLRTMNNQEAFETTMQSALEAALGTFGQDSYAREIALKFDHMTARKGIRLIAFSGLREDGSIVILASVQNAVGRGRTYVTGGLDMNHAAHGEWFAGHYFDGRNLAKATADHGTRREGAKNFYPCSAVSHA
jgi:hypothetical protein